MITQKIIQKLIQVFLPNQLWNLGNESVGQKFI